MGKLIKDSLGQGHLSRLLDHAENLGLLNEYVQSLLPKNLREDCIVANVREKQLILFASNSAVATRIQFLLPKLLPLVKQHPMSRGVEAILCKVRPS